MNANQYQETYRIIKCLSFDQFRKIFSNMDEAWCQDKFGVKLEDVAKFVCALDNSNSKRLFDYLGDRLDSQADKENARVNCPKCVDSKNETATCGRH